MQALNVPLPAAAAPVPDDEDDDAAGVVLLELPDDPQAAASRAIAANPAAMRIFALKINLLCPGAPQVPGELRLDR
jgi:hypothetical protein